jgi:hypothetical protein
MIHLLLTRAEAMRARLTSFAPAGKACDGRAAVPEVRGNFTPWPRQVVGK